MGIASSALGGLFTLINSGINIAAAKKQEERQHQYNLESAEIQQGYNKENMALQYQYGEQAANNADARTRQLYNDLQSPQAKVEQLRNAGLSPGLMYGGSGSIGSSIPSGSQGGGAASQAINVQPNKAINPFENANMALTWAQTAKLLAEAKNTDEDTDGTKIDNKIKRATFNTQIATANAELDKIIAESNNQKTQSLLTKLKGTYQKYENIIKAETLEEQAEIIEKTLEEQVEIVNQAKIKSYIDKETQEDIIKNIKETAKKATEDALYAKFKNDDLNELERDLLNKKIEETAEVITGLRQANQTDEIENMTFIWDEINNMKDGPLKSALKILYYFGKNFMNAVFGSRGANGGLLQAALYRR